MDSLADLPVRLFGMVVERRASVRDGRCRPIANVCANGVADTVKREAV